ncbi:MAG: nuclear transport factor 2 family protein [Bacteroidetes bacterium]|nr:nuclear transport factor 2 family protein [Bacteroidota bacterium]
MKKIVLLAAIICCTISISAQQPRTTGILEAVEALRSAMVDANKAKLEALTLPQLSYGHSSGHVDNRNTFIEKLVSGKSDFVSIELSEQTVTISGKTALVRHILRAKTNDDGKPGEVQLKVLLVWQKQKGQWKLLARQAVKFS